ncbi:PIH1 domain-containing protein 1-like [Hetaerina americana]|uniref:PIH1 domain-containing protein 1-like n=1 Tax=Hetaerina americana TaxID=62018 RepID=UPI003A7F2CDD
MSPLQEPEGEIENILLQRVPESSNLPWTTIKPIPGFCVKLRKSTTDRGKVFINICKTDQIPAPEDKSESELMEILKSDEPSTYRVPMSVGEERPDIDKSGNPCSVYDIVINSAFYKKVEGSQFYRQFLITAILEALEDKYDLQLEKEEFAVLKGRKCKGGMAEHKIQVRSKPLVQMMSSNEMGKNSNKKLDSKPGAEGPKKPLISEIKSTPIIASNVKATTEKSQRPPYILKCRSEETGEKVILAEILLRNVLFAKDIEIYVGEDRILLTTKSSSYSLDIFLPHLINQEKTVAEFSKENKVLMLEMPMKQ